MMDNFFDKIYFLLSHTVLRVHSYCALWEISITTCHFSTVYISRASQTLRVHFLENASIFEKSKPASYSQIVRYRPAILKFFINYFMNRFVRTKIIFISEKRIKRG